GGVRGAAALFLTK
ncbi:N-acetyl-D-glucosamine kinase, partial [Haemophilus influenzae]